MEIILGMIIIFIIGFLVGGSVIYSDTKEQIEKVKSLENLRIRYGIDK
jgi:hypothetical protein